MTDEPGAQEDDRKLSLEERLARLGPNQRALLEAQLRGEPTTGHQLVARTLRDLDITHVYGVAGRPVYDTFGACAAAGLRLIGTHHQQPAALMAAAHNYFAGRQKAATIVSSGVAAANAIAAAVTARDNCWPLVVLAGSAPTGATGYFMALDTVELFRPITKWATCVTETRAIPESIARAFEVAMRDRPGPVLVQLPENVLTGLARCREEASMPAARPALEPDPAAVAQAMALLHRARRPLLIVGKGLRWSAPFAALRELVDALALPFITSPIGRGAIPDNHPLCMNAIPWVAQSGADLVLVLGARLDWTFRYGRHLAPDARIIRVDVHAAEFDAAPGTALGVHADAGAFLRQLLAQSAGGSRDQAQVGRDRAWLAELEEARQRISARREAQSAGDAARISPWRFAREMRDALPKDAITIFDGNLVMAACQRTIPAHLPASRLTPGTSGGLGVGIPYAIAAKIEHPERPVVAICGDFAFGLSAMELETAVRHNVPIVVVVANNDGNSGSLQQRMHLSDSGAESVMMFRPGLRYEKVMAIFGGRAEHVDRPEGIGPALTRALADGRPACINVAVDPDAPFPADRSQKAAVPADDDILEAPKQPDLDARRAALGPEKLALLARRLATSRGTPSRRPLAQMGGQSGIAAPSFAQQRLWLLDRLQPGGAEYNESYAAELTGELRVEALRDALNAIVRRHDVLRARFALVRESPMQVIAPELAVALEVEDLSALPEDTRRAEALQRASDEALAPFDLATGPLLRVRLLRLDERRHLLLLTLHHIVTDGWSSAVLARELSALYGAHCRGEPPPLAELPVQYADYAAWQREFLQGTVLETQLGYWKRALADLPELDLPADRPRPAVARHLGDSAGLVLDADLTRALQDLGRGQGATLFMTLLAAFQVLLYRYTGQEDVAVGVPIAGRTRPELECLVGFFVNTLVLRGDLSGEVSFRDYLAQVRERALDAYAHQDLPFEKLVEELAPKRDLSRNPLVQVSFNLVNVPRAALKLDGVTVERLPHSHTSVKFDLSLRVEEVAGRLHAAFEYSIDLFDASTIERLAGHWRTLLEAIVADPGLAIARLPLLTPGERRHALRQWHGVAQDYPRDACLHTLFEAAAARTPDAVAVEFTAGQLTYRELNARANQLAHHLRALGVGPDVRVAVAMERSLELVVALLGVLKAGGAYVPLEPDHPPQRLAFMLADTQAIVLLTQRHLLGSMPPLRCPALCLDSDGAGFGTQPETNPACTASATSLAYVVYTSGSTGEPKGVLIEHRGACNHLHGFARAHAVSPDDRVLQTAPLGFDMSLWQLLLPLLCGARLVLPEPAAHRSGDELVALIRRAGVTILRMVPTMLSVIVNTPGFAQCSSLRMVISAGEVLDPGLARRFHALSNAALGNAYGPTETTFFTTFWACRRDETRSRIPVGRPIGNTRVHLLDSVGEPVPIGAPGEVHIGGDGVARGYLNRPDLDATAFVADPFAHRPGERMYRTGDIARRLPDGSIELLGRRDRQVKVRGVRVEPGEIEALLTRQPKVRQAVVVLREDVPGDKRLVAYVCPRDDGLSATDLRAFARQNLPDYMVPAAFVLLPELPLTRNGKVDRHALPLPAFDGNAPARMLPRTPIETALAEAMAEVLNLDRIGIDDSFFDLGGHSLSAVRLTSRIREILNIDLSLRQLFETPTVRALALAASDVAPARVADPLLAPRA